MECDRVVNPKVVSNGVSSLSTLPPPPPTHTSASWIVGEAKCGYQGAFFFFFFSFQNLMSASLSTSLFVSHPF